MHFVMSVGEKVAMPNTTCLPEIYGEHVAYLAPYGYDVDIKDLEKKKILDARELLDYINQNDYSISLEEIYAQPKSDAKELLSFYSWDKTSNELNEMLRKIPGKLNAS